MAVILYRPGNTYKSPKGIRCECKICELHSVQHLLDNGWFKTPEEVYPEEKEEEFDVNSLYEEPEDAE